MINRQLQRVLILAPAAGFEINNAHTVFFGHILQPVDLAAEHYILVFRKPEVREIVLNFDGQPSNRPRVIVDARDHVSTSAAILVFGRLIPKSAALARDLSPSAREAFGERGGEPLFPLQNRQTLKRLVHRLTERQGRSHDFNFFIHLWVAVDVLQVITARAT